MSFEIDADIRVARTLPGRVYSDPELFRAQRDSVFARTWQYAAHDDVVKVAGQVYPFSLVPGALDEPLLLTRDHADAIHCVSNVCTHRGTLVVEGPSHEQQLRCRYHGRRFTLDGKFHSMPEFEGTRDFPSADDDLRPVALDRFERFLMVGRMRFPIRKWPAHCKFPKAPCEWPCIVYAVDTAKCCAKKSPKHSPTRRRRMRRCRYSSAR